ncbi:MAG: hypothetical protein HC796_02805 [Synechococcaceae cyanobacterium RL_1_2]|nr:hypothetical protein [Synechococcaceae cyanobacterium RL_1_2]
MVLFRWKSSLAAFLTAIAGSIALQSVVISPVQANPLTGKDYPLTMSFSTLDRGWNKISVGGQYEMADLIKNWSGLFGQTSFDNTYFTQGQTTRLAGKTYLVAYRVPLEVQPINIMSFATMMYNNGEDMCENFFKTKPLTMDTQVSLALLNLETVGSLNDVMPLDVEAEIAKANERYEQQQQTCDQIAFEAAQTEAKNNLWDLNYGQDSRYYNDNGFYDQIDGTLSSLTEPDTENYTYEISVADDYVFHRRSRTRMGC